MKIGEKSKKKRRGYNRGTKMKNGGKLKEKRRGL